MSDKLIYNAYDDTHFVDYNQWLKRFDTQLNKPTNQNLMKVPKVIKPTNKKSLL